MKFATTTTLLASTAAALRLKAPQQKHSSLTNKLIKLRQDEVEEDDAWLSYGFDSEFEGTLDEICQLESEYWAAIFTVLDTDGSGAVDAEEFLSAAATLTEEVAFGDSDSLYDWVIDHGTMDPSDNASKIGLWYLNRADTSDITDEQYEAVLTIVTFIDEHYNVGEWAGNGKISRAFFRNAMTWLSDALAQVDFDSLARLDVDESGDVTWDELYPAIQNDCYGYTGGGLADMEFGGYAGVETCRLEQEFYWATFHIMDVDKSGTVSAAEFLGAAETLTGEFAFGGESSLVTYLIENAGNDWDPPRISLDRLAELEHDLSDEDFLAIQVIVEFLDQIEYGGQYPNGKLTEFSFEFHMDKLVEALAEVPMEDFEMLAGEDGEVSWDELAPIVEGICFAGDGWSAAAIAPVPEEAGGCEESFVDKFGNGCDWYWDVSFVELRCKAVSYMNDEGYKGVDCCAACW